MLFKSKASKVMVAMAALCASVPQSEAQGTRPVSRNGSWVIAGRKNPNERSVWIHVEKAEAGAASEEDVFEPKTDDYAERIFFRYGPGIYNVSVWVSELPATNGAQFFQVTTLQVENQDTRDPALTPSHFVESEEPEIVALAKEIVAGKVSDLEKSMAIHDWVAKHVAYDTESYFAGITAEKTSLETLHSGKAVCTGYAFLSAALHRAIGIPARVMHGLGNPGGLTDSERTNQPKHLNHAWNEIFVSGQWIPEDPTWDAGGIIRGSKEFIFQLSHAYFNPSAEEFAKTHLTLQVAGK